MTKLKATARHMVIASTFMFACLGTTVQASELSKQVNQDVTDALTNALSNQVTLFITEINRDVEAQISKTLTELGSIILPTEEKADNPKLNTDGSTPSK